MNTIKEGGVDPICCQMHSLRQTHIPHVVFQPGRLNPNLNQDETSGKPKIKKEGRGEYSSKMAML